MTSHFVPFSNPSDNYWLVIVAVDDVSEIIRSFPIKLLDRNSYEPDHDNYILWHRMSRNVFFT